jgi:very-short-patch-repair endonuclease
MKNYGESFFNKSKILYNNKYDYSLFKYINNKTKGIIICPIHGEFLQTPNDHLGNHSCIKCNKNIPSTEEFIQKCNKIHNNFFDYTLTDYINNHTNIKIICPIHGEFSQTPMSHLRGGGCKLCNDDKLRKTKEKFIKDANIIHNYEYGYLFVDYKNSNTKVIIECYKHGIFKQTPLSHLSGSGCPKCNESKGEKEIRRILDENNIKYENQKTFNNCKYKGLLKFDFYIKDLNLCIEYDGEQHFEIKEHWGGIKEFEKTQLRDKIKTDYCITNNIRLIRISYNDNIVEKLYFI